MYGPCEPPTSGPSSHVSSSQLSVSRMAASLSGTYRPWSVSSMRSTKLPPVERAAGHAKRAVRTLPRWRNPVGEGANRVRMGATRRGSALREEEDGERGPDQQDGDQDGGVEAGDRETDQAGRPGATRASVDRHGITPVVTHPPRGDRSGGDGGDRGDLVAGGHGTSALGDCRERDRVYRRQRNRHGRAARVSGGQGERRRSRGRRVRREVAADESHQWDQGDDRDRQESDPGVDGSHPQIAQESDGEQQGNSDGKSRPGSSRQGDGGGQEQAVLDQDARREDEGEADEGGDRELRAGGGLAGPAQRRS